MQCAAVAEQLLAHDEDDARLASQVEQHVATCPRCATLARRLDRLDGLLESALVVEPPADLQLQLVQLARAAARPPEPAAQTWWERLRAWWSSGGLLLTRPNVAIAQSLAALMLVLAGWQVLGWLNTFTPVVGDVPYAMQLVASSPAVGYLGGVQSLDLQSLLIWSGVGLAGWLVSESGPLRRVSREP